MDDQFVDIKPVGQPVPLKGPGEGKPGGPLASLATNLGRILVALFVPIVTFIGLRGEGVRERMLADEVARLRQRR